MKVLMIPSWYPTPGSPLLGTFFKEQAEALAAQGISVAVAHVGVGSDFNLKNGGIQREENNGVLTYTYTRPNLTPRWEYGRMQQRKRMLEALYRRIEKEWGRPDVVNLRSSLHGYEAVSLCRKHNLPLFFMEHSSFVLTEKADSKAIKRLKFVMQNSAVNACVSNALRDVMQPFGNTRIIHDPVDGDTFKPKDVTDNSDFIFRAMGQLRPIKGYDFLIRSFSRLKEKTQNSVKLEIAGAGLIKNNLQALIEELGVGENCRLVGSIPREQVVDYMNGCNCFICSSRVETLSCVLTEAGACGKPVISTACGGPQDIVTPETGILVPVDDIEDMSEAMMTMMNTASDYDSSRIRELTLSRFGRQEVIKQLIQACQDAAGGTPSSSEGKSGSKKGLGLTMTIMLETLKISTVTIGGGYVMMSLITECYTRKHKWLSGEEMLDVFAVSQSMPGPIALNSSVMAGYRAAGIRGSLAAAVGMTMPPLVIMALIAVGYTWFRTNEYVSAIMNGIRACVSGLLIWATITLGRTAIKSGKNIWTAVIFGISLVLTLFTSLHTLVIIGGGLITGLVFHAIYSVIGKGRPD
ncbi:MAG: chromate transporter [Oscillospiraceae bacterium]|nr:chromate transporter [Oscillospiraceae bacterium]MDD4546882.1 chromate transporter [Oscillospiraceae bacterium]